MLVAHVFDAMLSFLLFFNLILLDGVFLLRGVIVVLNVVPRRAVAMAVATAALLLLGFLGIDGLRRLRGIRDG